MWGGGEGGGAEHILLGGWQLWSLQKGPRCFLWSSIPGKCRAGNALDLQELWAGGANRMETVGLGRGAARRVM